MIRLPKLRTALLCRFLLLALLPLTLVGLFTFRLVTDTITENLKTKNLLLATTLASEIQETLREPQSVLRQLSSVMRDDYAVEGKVADTLLDSAVSNSRYFESIFLVDRQGQVLHVGLPDRMSVTREDFLGLDLSQMTFVRQAARRDKILWSDTFLSPLGNHQSLSLVFPIGNLLLVGNLNLDYLGQLGRRDQSGSRVSFSIIDHSGMLILHSKPLANGQRTNLGALLPVREGLAGHQGTYPFHWQGRNLVGTVAAIPTTGWLVLVSQDVALAYAASHQLRNTFLVGCALALGLALLAALAFSARLTTPLRELAAGAQEIAAGDYLVGLPPQRHQETERLADSFRDMAAEINLREKKLTESREHYLRLFNSGNDTVLVHGIAADGRPGGFLEANDIACETLGYVRSELLSMSPQQVIAVFREQPEQAVDILATGCQKGFALFETEMIARDGRRIPVELNVRFFEQLEGVTALAVARDVSERRMAETALRQSERGHRLLSLQLKALFDGIPDSLVLYDNQLRMLWVNRGAVALHDRPEQQLLGHSCFEVLHARTKPCCDCAVQRSFASGRTETAQREMGEGRLIEVRAFPILNEQGGVVRVIELAQDVTEKSQVQQETIRTGQLVAIGELAAGVAHEINNPINGIINYAQILATQAERAGASSDLATRIMKEGDRIAAIVGNLLSFSRKKQEQIQPVPLHDVVKDALALMKTQLHRDGIKVELLLPDNLPPVAGRYQQLEQVLINLLSNARHALNSKFTGHDEGKLLEVSAGELDEGQLRLIVCDYGVGIPDQLVTRILNPFFTTKPAGEGTGLGLSISHGIIRDHGGQLSFESREGEMTRVMIDLPVYREVNARSLSPGDKTPESRTAE